MSAYTDGQWSARAKHKCESRAEQQQQYGAHAAQLTAARHSQPVAQLNAFERGSDCERRQRMRHDTSSTNTFA